MLEREAMGEAEGAAAAATAANETQSKYNEINKDENENQLSGKQANNRKKNEIKIVLQKYC